MNICLVGAAIDVTKMSHSPQFFRTGLKGVKVHEAFFFTKMANSVTVCHKTGRRFRSNRCRNVRYVARCRALRDESLRALSLFNDHASYDAVELFRRKHVFMVPCIADLY